MSFIEIFDHYLVNWREDKAGFGIATLKVALDPGITKEAILVYQGTEYKIQRITVDRRQIVFKKIGLHIPEEPPPAPAAPKVDPNTLVRAEDPSTSREAAFTLNPDTGDFRIATCLYPDLCLNCDEMDDIYREKDWINHDGEPHKRIDTLRKKGWVEDTGMTRKSKKTHKEQTVWRLTEAGRMGMTKLLSQNY